VDRLDGTIALVTGTGGLGLTTARHLSKEGATVVLAGVDTGGRARGRNELQQIILAIEGLALFLPMDWCSKQEVSQMIATIVHRYGRLDYAFNDLASITSQFAEHAFASSLKRSPFQGMWICLQSELQQMLTQHHGVIVSCYCTPAGLRYYHMVHVYSTSRYRVTGASQGMPSPISHQTVLFDQFFDHQGIEP
jgi:NADP-dependent 3-hydroxy acid dehydrogenase YdfG